MEYYPFHAMNTQILLAAEGKEQQVQEGFDKAREYIEACERRFTRFSEESELSHLNQSSGNWFQASSELFDLVYQAQRFVSLSCGLFNPAILPALRSVGYDRSMDEIRLAGSLATFSDNIYDVPDFQTIRLETASNGIWMPPGMQIDLGGIAKGWIAEKTAILLSGFATTCAVNAGGDLFAIGIPKDENAWQIGLEDPLHPEKNLAVLNVKPGAVATSSIVKRAWKQGDHQRHHLIDTRTGQPAQTDWLSVTVFARHGIEAEVFAKSLLIAGSNGYLDILQKAGNIAFIAIDREGNLWGNSPTLIQSMENTHVNY